MKKLLTIAATAAMLAGPTFAQTASERSAGAIDQLVGVQKDTAEFLSSYGVPEDKIALLTVGDLINIHLTLASDMGDAAKKSQILATFQRRGLAN
ncbi:hypothetical protein [uncultured Litoreibacter sp.]|uniref:hypothetical protein n=1 Tax=uncultured Litoreibacter sp. TaxID=1392394 RepID=UPI0026274A96|nr:hypothetical protein [uncultured Litoreibacter sp.]